MFFLLRTAFWLCVVLALLPSLVPTQAPAPTDVGAADAVTAASATVADLRGFCERRPDACAAGSQFAVAFAQRAQAGAKIVFDFVADRLVKTEHAANRAGAVAPAAGNGEAPRGDVAKPGPQNPTHKAPAGAAAQSTLTDADMIPPWRGPQPRKDAPPRRPPAQAAL